jgi:lipopolysaccharide/colanic/teichoic acid biosynthesis glycosyltransferase
VNEAVEGLGDEAAVGLPQEQLSRARIGSPLGYRLFKRTLDLAIVVPALLFFLPLMAVLAAAIRLDSSGPALFRQQRRGLGFEPFTIMKFRSLRQGARDPHARYEMVESDPRITRVGAWLRKTSLDEAPQLFNVLGGSMSLVGPRPLVEWESLQALAGFAERFQVKPGLTGWSQVTVRNSVGFDERCEKDVEYARRKSVWLDLRILALTPQALARRDGIYPDSPVA